MKNLLIFRGNVNLEDHNGRTALHFATKLRNRDLVEFLVEKKADINQFDHEQKSALHIAVDDDDHSMVTFLGKLYF